MIYTLALARPFVAPAVAKCPDTDGVRDLINEAQMRLLEHADWKDTLSRIMCHVTNNHVTLPPEYEYVRAVNFECYPGRVWSEFYEYLGPCLGSEQNTGTCNKALKALPGRVPTIHDIDNSHPSQLIALSTEASDVGKKLHVKGFLDNKEHVLTSGVMGEDVTIMQWSSGVEGNRPTAAEITPNLSASSFREVTQVVKPQTKGYITLYAHETSTNYHWGLSKYHPLETNPGYRRYIIQNHDCTNGDCITMLVKASYVPNMADNDILMIQNLPAIKAMVQAIWAERARDMNLAASYSAQSLFFLNNQSMNEHTNETEVRVNSDDFGGSINGRV